MSTNNTNTATLASNQNTTPLPWDKLASESSNISTLETTAKLNNRTPEKLLKDRLSAKKANKKKMKRRSPLAITTSDRLKKKIRATKLTLKERKWLSYVFEGKSGTEAAKLAGYKGKSENSFWQIAQANYRKLNEIIEIWLDEEHLDNASLKMKLIEGLNAIDWRYFAYKGEVKDQRAVIPWEIRHKFLVTAMQLKGLIGQKDVNPGNTNVGIAINFGFDRGKFDAPDNINVEVKT